MFTPTMRVRMEMNELQQVVDSIIDRQTVGGLLSLTECDRIILLVWCFAGQVDNGGFAQFFFNSTGAHARETVEALREMGSRVSASLLEQAISLFPDGAVPFDLDERNDVMQAFPAEVGGLFEKLDRDYFANESAEIYARLWRYWKGSGAGTTCG